MSLESAFHPQNQLFSRVMSKFSARTARSLSARRDDGTDRTDRNGGLFVIIGMVVAGILLALALVSTGGGEAFLLAILSVLAMTGVFFLFALTAGLVQFDATNSKEQYAQIAAQTATEGVQVTTRDGTQVYANAAFAQLLGQDAQAAPAPLEDIFAGEPEAAEALYRLLRASERGEAGIEEFSIHIKPDATKPGKALAGGHPSGKATAGKPGKQPATEDTTRRLRLAVQPITDKSDGASEPLVVWKFSDVTAERSREVAARQSLELELARNDVLPVGLLRVSVDGRIEKMNHTLGQWLGYEGLGESSARKAGVGHRLESVLCKGDRSVLQVLRRSAQGGGEVTTQDVNLLDAQGREVPVRLISQADDIDKRMTKGSRAARSALNIVVLSRVQSQGAELADEASDIRLARFFQTAPFGIATVDRDGRIVSKNGSFARLFKAERSARKQTISGLLTRSCNDEARDAVTKTLARVLKDRSGVAPVEISFGQKGEDTRRIYIAPFDGSRNAREAAILYVTDTTEQKALELKFAQSQKMEAVGQLAGGIAHDFNNVLTVIIGLSDLFLQTRRPTDAGYNDIMQIRSNANRAAGLVRQLLAFSRKQTLSAEVLALNDVVQDLGYSLSRLLGERTELKMRSQRDLWLVKADETQIEQVVINLTVNARDAMPDGGRLTIRTKNISERDSMKLADVGVIPGEYVMIEVKDTGVGMPANVMEKIFEPFYSTKDIGKGTGLGLSTVYGIVKQTGGYIIPESKPGKGTTFRVYLPSYQGDPEADAKIRSKVTTKERTRDLTGTGRVLLVEDEDGVRSFAVRALQRQGYEVLEASTGVEALEVLAEDGAGIDIVVSDVVMPEMDGPTLLKELRKTNSDLKFIFMSGYPDEAFKKSLGDDLEFGFLAKPFTLPQLAAKVKEELET